MSNVARVAGQAANTLVKPLSVEDVFSTDLYAGESLGTTNTITNGIDLDGEGGLLWIKSRGSGGNDTYGHYLFDTERGANNYLQSQNTDAQNNQAFGIQFNSDGWQSGGGYDAISNSDTSFGSPYVSWTFRKAPKFFDVVTYTGTGSAQTISHNLGSVPGMIIVKSTSNAFNWVVYHRGTDATAPEDYITYLDLTNARSDVAGAWNDTAPTSTEFTVGTTSAVNFNGGTFVAYLFAHNDGDGDFGPNGDADIIKCGSYTGNGTSQEIDLGFEAQWVLIKNTTNTQSWAIIDNMRGFTVEAVNDQILTPNNNTAEAPDNRAFLTSSGFGVNSADYRYNGSGSNYIYIAIRRGPMAVPTDATEVFAIDTKNSSGDNTDPTWDLGIVTDMAIQKFNKTTSTTPLITSRLTGTQYLKTSETDAETSNSGMEYDYMTGVGTGNGSTTDVNDIVWGWQRRPNYFDVVAYTGDGAFPNNVSHNLGVAPEMMWVKARSNTTDWEVYHTGLDATSPAGYSIKLNESDAAIAITRWYNTEPTDTVFTVSGNNTNASGQDYIAYLFASLDGISKVGSYTGNGSTQNIDCGFSSGARFVLIRRTDAAGNWLVVDTERGLVSGNDPVLLLDATNAEQTNLDIVDPTSSGFIVNGNSANWNASGGTYIFYAIA